nr:retrovirus-related Pol polyprotein from transposon TNT 1-94 [Tanacetum cinerariifolium]
MQKRRNDVKARTTLLLALPDEHQLRFTKYKTAQELWAAILKIFGGNEATKKTKKNLLKQQYGNFKAEGKETLEHTFNRLQAIISQLEFMDVEIEQDDLNQKLLTSLAPEWLMHTIVWRNRNDLDTMSLDDLYNHLKVYEPEVQKKSDSQNMVFISSAKNSSGNEEVNTASIPTASTQVSPTSANVAAASIGLDTACTYIDSQSNGSQIKFWKKTRKNISIQGTDVAGFDKSKVEYFNCHKMGHFARECRAPRSQDRGRGENYRQGTKEEEQAPKTLIAIDVVGWDWSFMENKEENHALVADEEAPTKFSLMAKSSYVNKVFDSSLCSKACKKNTDSLNSEITDLSEKLSDKMLKKEKEGLDSKLTGFQSASKDLDNLIGSQRSDKNKEGLGYSAVPPPAQVYSPPKKDMSWTRLPKFADDTITDYTRPSPSIESNLNDLQNNSSSVSKMENQLVASYLSLRLRKTWEKNNYTYKSRSPRTVFHKYDKTPTRTTRPNMNAAQPKRTSFYKPAHSYVSRPFQRKSAVRTQVRVPRVPTVNRKFPTVNRKFPTGNSKVSIADLGNKGKAGNSHNNIDDKGYWDSGCSRHMTGNISYLSDYEPYDGGTPRQHNMYSIDLNNIVPHKDLTCLVAKASTDESMLWHRRLGHLNFKTMNRLVRHNLVKGLPSKCFNNDHTCVACLKEKQHKASCKTKLVNSVTKPLYTLHMDLFGLTSVSSLNHKWYCLVVTDDFSRFTWTFFLKTKDETSGILRNFITEIENLKELKIKIIRCDNMGEFRNKEMNDFCSRKGIKREFSNARTPQQNGVAERRNRTLIEAARTMVLVNKSQNKTPYELFNGRTPAIGFLKPFGCHVMILNTLDNLGKFDAKGDEVVSVGTTSTNFIGIKDAASQDVKKDVSSLRYIALLNWFHEAHLESSTSNAQDACYADAPEGSGNSNPTATSTNPLADQIETLTIETLIPTISSPVPTAGLDDSPQLSKPKKISDALKDPSWVEAMQEELLQFKIQNDERGIVIRNKARLVAQGHTQEEGIDYEEVFAPVARIEAIILFLAYASFMGFTVYQMDVKSAFLYGTINEEVYMMQPPRFYNPEFPARVYKVEKAMYGLHQAPRAWYGTLSKYLLTNGFHRGIIDQTLFIRRHRGDFILVQVHQVTPKECHMHVVKRIFRYLKGHLKLGLWYPKESPFDLVAYLDSDYGGATQDKKSTTRGCQFLDRRLILWQCKKQTIVTTSTTEAEYVAAASGCGQVLHHFIRDCFEKKLISVDHIHTDDNVADFLTKPFDARRFQYLVVEQAMRGFVKGNHINYTTFIVDFVEASHLRYALTINPTVYVSHIRQFWSTARIETTDEGTKILANVDDEPASPFGDDSQGEVCSTVSGLEAEQDRANIIKSSTLPHDSPPRVTSLAADEGKISSLKARIKLLEDKDGVGDNPSGEDATIKGRSLETGEEAGIERSTDKGRNDTEEMLNVLTFLDATSILTSIVQVSVPHAAEVATVNEFAVKPVVENKSSEEETKAVRKNNDVPIIKEWVSDNEVEEVTQPKIKKKTVKPSIVKKEFVKPRQQEKTARKTVKKVEHNRINIHRPKGNKRN